MAESLYDLYYAVFNDKSRGFWNITASFPRYGTFDSKGFFESLFKPSLDNNNSGNAYHFIFEFFESIGKESVFWYLKDTQTQLSMLDSNHTLSALLLGMVVKDKLGIKIQNLPTTYYDEEQNFAYYWTLTCICHDIARQIEEDSKTSNKQNRKFKHIASIQDFYKEFNISEDLQLTKALEKEGESYAEKASLIENYFSYCLKTKINNAKKIDHGIAGAILFYAAMMKELKIAQEKDPTNLTGPWNAHGGVFHSNFEQHILFITETIAEHNMWVPTTSKDINRYRSYHLDELIARKPISYDTVLRNNTEAEDKSFLFFLGLIDALEPLKGIVKRCEADKKDSDISDIDMVKLLQSIQVDFETEPSKRIKITNTSPYYLTSSWMRVNDGKPWLNIEPNAEYYINEY